MESTFQKNRRGIPSPYGLSFLSGLTLTELRLMRCLLILQPLLSPIVMLSRHPYAPEFMFNFSQMPHITLANLLYLLDPCHPAHIQVLLPYINTVILGKKYLFSSHQLEGTSSIPNAPGKQKLSITGQSRWGFKRKKGIVIQC